MRMRFLGDLQSLAFKLANLTYPLKNSLNYAVVALGRHGRTQERCFASKTSVGGDNELNGEESFKEAFPVLSLLSDNSRKVELLTESLEKLKSANKTDGVIPRSGGQKNKSEEIRSRIKSRNQDEKAAVNLDIETEIRNLKNFLYNPHNLTCSVNSNEFPHILFTSTSLESYNRSTIPLHLNTIIQTMDTDFEKIPQHQLQNLEVPECNRYLTLLAANLCSTNVFTGSSADLNCRKNFCTKDTLDANSIQKISNEKNDRLKKIDPSAEAIVQDLLKKYDSFQKEISALATASTVTGKGKRAENTGDGKKDCISEGNGSKGLGLLDPQLYKKSVKEAEIKRKEIAKAAASCKQKLTPADCQSNKSTAERSDLNNPSKCSDLFTNQKFESKLESVKHFGSLTEPSSPLRCSSKAAESKSGIDLKKCESQNQKIGAKSKCSSNLKSTSESNKSCSKETKPKLVSKCGQETNPSDTGTCSKPKTSKCCQPAKKAEAKKCSSKSETSVKCGLKSESRPEDPCKIPPTTKSKLCSSSPGKEDPCKVESITLKKPSNKSASKCTAPSSPSKTKCEAEKVDKTSSCGFIPKTTASTPKLKPKCVSLSASQCISDTTASKCSAKCGSRTSCVASQKKPTDSDSDKACKRVGIVAKKACDSEPKNPCKSPCDSMAKPKPKCGRPPRGDTRPRCKKDSKCGSKTPSPCASKSETKCGTEPKPSKCASKTCSPSPKSSKTSCSSKSKIAPSGEPPKRKIHNLSNFPMSNSVIKRNYSDDCPEKPKGGYKLESERSDEYRRETCENFSWKDTKSRKKRVVEPKNCYPDETKEFCPDTACYRVYAETSRKADKKSKKRPKDLSKEANKLKNVGALCSKRNTRNSFDLQKRHLSSDSRQNEEALIQKPHSVCTKELILPDISDDEALINVDSVALSDTDIYMFETGGRHTPGLTLGNEASGVVSQVGRSICNIKPGDHVVLESGVPCFKCDLCKTGRYNLCNNINFKGFLKNQCIHPASFCHKICQPIPLEHAALVPQLTLGCNACHQACIKPNSNVAIIGSCAKTVCAAICAIAKGAENVCVMCGLPETQILIQQFVTQKVDCFDSSATEKGIVRAILSLLGTFPDVVINFSANTKTMNAAIMALKPAGVCIVAGFVSECISYNIMDALMKEIRIDPSFRSKNMFPKAIHLLESGRAPLDCLIANCVLCKWNELEGAFKLALSEGNNGPRKAIVKCQLEIAQPNS